MKTKKIVIFITTILTFLCSYYLSFTWMDIKMNERACIAAKDEKGNIDLYKKQEYLDSYWDKTAFKAFGINYTYEDIKNKTLNLGLDLQGGMSATLEVSISDLILHLTNKDHKDIIYRTIKGIPEENISNDKAFWNKFLDTYSKENPNLTLRECFINKENNKLVGKSTNDVLSYLSGEVEKGIQKSFDIISLRIDKSGAAQPNLQRLGKTNKIQVELAGARNPERTRQMLKGIAKLEFWNVYKEDKIVKIIDSINAVLKKSGVAEDEISELNHYMIFDTADVKKVQKTLDRQDIKSICPKDLVFMWESKNRKNLDGNFSKLYAIKTGAHGESLITGEDLEYARGDYYNGKNTVVIKMNTIPTKIWRRITAANIGNQIAITMDNKVLTAPVVSTEIPNGISQITGDYTKEELNDLVNALNVGSLPTSVKITEETIVGPTLSEISQKQGIVSIMFGLLFTFIFMLVFYSKSGWIADIALAFNCLFLIGILVQFGVVMTLAGIAGIVLTIGMAIDANVLINERIKEEIRKGRDIFSAVAVGYKQAGWSIFDSNLTTFLTGFILFLFGRGMIRGFATTLMTGIATSFFCSFFLTKYIFNKKVENDSLEKMKFSFNYNKDFLSNINFDFLKFRKKAYILSGSIIVIGFICLFAQKGLKMGVDFTGGRNYVIKMSEPVDLNNLKTKLSNFTKENVEVKTFGMENILKIKTNYKLADNKEENEDSITKEMIEFISNATDFKSTTNEDLKERTFTVVSASKTGPSIALDFQKSAQKAILYTLLVMFVYIFFRFISWQFSVATIIALLHDVLVVFAAFGIMRFVGYTVEIDQVIIGAILTIIGYSINSTIIIFNRLKENRHNFQLLSENINASINETLSRTLITSFTTIIIVLILLIFGGEVLRNFALTLFIGLTAGTFSSIFISAPILNDIHPKNCSNDYVRSYKD